MGTATFGMLQSTADTVTGLPSPSQSSEQSRVSSLLGHHLRKHYLLLLNNREKQGFFLIDKMVLSHPNGTEEALRTITA